MSYKKVTLTVHGVFELADANKIFLYGDLSAGEVSCGDLVRAGTGQEHLEATISSVETVDGTPTGSHLALGLTMREADCDKWKQLPRGSEVKILRRQK